MRAVVQRVAQASVTGGGKTAAIGKGLCVLVGITHDDTKDDSDYLIKKLLSLRLFGSDSGPDRSDPVPDVMEEKAPSTQRWTSSVVDIQGEILLGAESEAMFYGMSERLRQQYNVEAVKDCVFGSDMNVSLVNVGPVTLILDSKQPKGG